jgi:hypothetical protein
MPSSGGFATYLVGEVNGSSFAYSRLSSSHFFSATVHYLDFFVAIVLEDPEYKSGKPIIKIAIQNELSVICRSDPAHKSLEQLVVNDIAPDRVVNVALPPYKLSARDVSLLVCVFRIIVDFQNLDVWVIQVVCNPFGLT